MSSGKGRRFSPVKFGIFFVLILLLILVCWIILRKTAEKPDEFLAPVITVRPRRGRIEKTIGLSGQVETGRLLTLVPRVAGTLLFLDADPGTPVVKDQVVAQVDSAPYDLTYLQAQTAFSTAQSTWQRISALYASQAVTRQQYEEARTVYESSKAQYDLAQLNRDYTLIRSPIDGVVLIRHSTQGGMVNAGTPLVTLGDLEDLRIRAPVPEIHYRFFAEHWEDMPVRLRVPALGDEEFHPAPLSLAPYVSPETRSFLVEYAIPGAAYRGLRPGMFVKISFVLESQEDVYYLPFRVLGSQNRLWYVDEQQRAQYTEYIPEFFNENFFRIPGEWGAREFILEGQHFITPGQGVAILTESSIDVPDTPGVSGP
ncbi:MAG: efflux RND transporter periplasmic adaptor subunit [Spirochaetaceae bacterium]|jgi:RND family efflux transporter MFP subunit|nr:efflux RND transporter periplasmic adaptor subunit [Spirochaetaceae bacterium]